MEYITFFFKIIISIENKLEGKSYLLNSTVRQQSSEI